MRRALRRVLVLAIVAVAVGYAAGMYVQHTWIEHLGKGI